MRGIVLADDSVARSMRTVPTAKVTGHMGHRIQMRPNPQERMQHKLAVRPIGRGNGQQRPPRGAEETNRDNKSLGRGVPVQEHVLRKAKAKINIRMQPLHLPPMLLLLGHRRKPP